MVLAAAAIGWIAMGWMAAVLAHLVIRRYCDASRLEVQVLAAAGCGLAALCVSGPALVAAIILVLWSVCLSVIDRHTMRLPNVLTGAGAAGVAALSVATCRWQAAAVGAGLLAGMYLLVRVFAGGFGGGDVKLAVPLGGLTAMVGGQVWLVAAVGALALTVLGGVWRTIRRGGYRGPVPHGPSMCLASLVTLAALG